MNKPSASPSNEPEHPKSVAGTGDVERGEIGDGDEERALVERSRRGDTGAFDALVTRHRNRIYAMLYQMTRDEEDAWDLSQETFVRAWKSLAGFGGRSSFFTWLYRIASNLALDAIRKKKNRPTTPFDETLPGHEPADLSAAAGNPTKELARGEIRSRIDAALASLSPDHRAAIILKEIEGLQYHEIAEAVGCSIGTVMSRLFYARKKLQTLLRDLYEER